MMMKVFKSPKPLCQYSDTVGNRILPCVKSQSQYEEKTWDGGGREIIATVVMNYQDDTTTSYHGKQPITKRDKGFHDSLTTTTSAFNFAWFDGKFVLSMS